MRNLLGITFEKTDPPVGLVFLNFGDGAIVRLEVECLEAELRDVGPRKAACDCEGHTLTIAEPADEALRWRAFLDASADDFEAKFADLLAAKREAAADVDDAVGEDHRRRARARRRRADGIFAALRPRRFRAASACESPRRRSTRRSRPARSEALAALEFAHARILRLSPPADAEGRDLHRRARRRARLALAADRARSGSMCRAARRAILRRC